MADTVGVELDTLKSDIAGLKDEIAMLRQALNTLNTTSSEVLNVEGSVGFVSGHPTNNAMPSVASSSAAPAPRQPNNDAERPVAASSAPGEQNDRLVPLWYIPPLTHKNKDPAWCRLCKRSFWLDCPWDYHINSDYHKGKITDLRVLGPSAVEFHDRD